jgi:hypothetical protein
VSHGAIAERRALEKPAFDDTVPPPPTHGQRLATFDASVYDRLRVLNTELRRVAQQGGYVAVRVGRHRFVFGDGAGATSVAISCNTPRIQTWAGAR